jgi:membrane-associated phospholipid phosphatase
MAIAFQFAETRSQALLWIGVYAVLICLLPVSYIVWNVRRGKITDIHMKERRQRFGPFVFSILCAAMGWVVLRLMNTPEQVSSFALLSLLQLTVLAVITLVWQISIHAMSITGAVVAIGALFGLPQALVIAPLVPIVGVARIKLQRHTWSQVIAGTILGCILSFVLFALFIS